MRGLIVFVITMGMAGCGDSPSSASKTAPQSGEPHIRVKDTVGGGVGPVGGGRSREYEGPASQAPDWAKPKSNGGK